MNSWTNIKTIAKREIGGYFASPVAYVFIVIFLLLCGFFTFMLGGFFERREATLTSFFMWLPWLYLFLVPAIGMRLWSEERRQGTMELLLTMPVTAWEAIVGKFLASWFFLGLALFLTFPIVISVNILGQDSVDNGAIFCGYVGGFLLAGSYLAVTCLTSAMTRNQVISFIVALVICLLLVLAGFPPVTSFLMPWVPGLVKIVSSFSVFPHFDGLQKGVLDSRDLIFFISIVGFSLFTTGVIIRNIRSGH